MVKGQHTSYPNHNDGTYGGEKFHSGMKKSADIQCVQHGSGIGGSLAVHLTGFVFLLSECLNFMNT